MASYPHLIDIRDVTYLPLDHLSWYTAEKRLQIRPWVSLLGTLTVLTPVLCLRGCLTPRKLAFSVKEGSLGFHSPACSIRMPRGPHCYSSFLANFYVFPIYLDHLIVSDSTYSGGSYGCRDFFLDFFCHFLWFLVLA